MPLPCIRNSTAPRCQAKSKRTGLSCQNPAAFGCKTCRMHGAHKSRQAPSDENHWNYQDGRASKKKRAENAASESYKLASDPQKSNLKPATCSGFTTIPVAQTPGPKTHCVHTNRNTVLWTHPHNLMPASLATLPAPLLTTASPADTC